MTPREVLQKPGGVRLAAAILACALPVFMVSLDNLVVTTALTTIRETLSKEATASELQWVVNAYIVGFAAALLPGAALGDRYGRRLVYSLGLGVFTVASMFCALADSMGGLIIARAAQGLAAGCVLPISLTLLAEAVPIKMRSASVGIWSGISGLGIAMGPLVGGLVIDGLSWHWIFWINVPIGLLSVPLILSSLAESVDPADRGLDLLGMVLSSVAVIALVWAIVNGEVDGWNSDAIVIAFAMSGLAFASFILWERKCSSPMMPLSFYRSPIFVGTNLVSLAMNFGVFGAIYLLAQYLQFAQGSSASTAGFKTLAWTLMPMVSAPVAGVLASRVGGGRLMILGMALQAAGLSWLALVVRVDTPYQMLVGGMMLGGLGMGFVFSAASIVIVEVMGNEDRGRASGANSTVREIGGALGTAVLATVFTAHGGSYRSPQDFVGGMIPSVWVGVGVVITGALCGLMVRDHVRKSGGTDSESL